MALVDTLPHWFLLLVIIVVGFFVLKALVKFAIWAGAIGLIVYLVWVLKQEGKFYAWAGSN